MTNTELPADIPLGKTTEYQTEYNPGLLFPIPRATARAELGIESAFPGHGDDIWTAYEVSWLNPKGKPEWALFEFIVPCNTPNIIESKSLKLYLNSFNQSRFDDLAAVVETLSKDLSAVAGSEVDVIIADAETDYETGYHCLDQQDIEITDYSYRPELLAAGTEPAAEKLVSHLLKSNCPVTGQPDWASLYIDYQGPAIDHAALLKYIISFRSHAEFHEQCVERVFLDISKHCQPEQLTVCARYTRRGGLDINPVRSTEEDYPVIGRTIRQ